MRPGGTRPPTPTEQRALQGVDPYGPDSHLIAHELATIRTLAAQAGLEAQVERWVQILRGDSNHALVMRIARRHHLPRSVVAAEWTEDDIAAELAQDRLDAEDRIERCPNCGTRPDEVLDLASAKKGPLERGDWKWELTTCWFCSIGSRAADRLDEADRAAGATYRPAPRMPGDPLVDDGD